jgi:hypothetical protein
VHRLTSALVAAPALTGQGRTFAPFSPAPEDGIIDQIVMPPRVIGVSCENSFCAHP